MIMEMMLCSKEGFSQIKCKTVVEIGSGCGEKDMTFR